MKLRNIDKVSFLITYPAKALIEEARNYFCVSYKVVTEHKMQSLINHAFLFGDRRYIVLGFDTGRGDYTKEN